MPYPADKVIQPLNNWGQGLSVSFKVGLHGVALVWTDGRAVGRTEVTS